MTTKKDDSSEIKTINHEPLDSYKKSLKFRLNLLLVLLFTILGGMVFTFIVLYNTNKASFVTVQDLSKQVATIPRNVPTTDSSDTRLEDLVAHIKELKKDITSVPPKRPSHVSDLERDQLLYFHLEEAVRQGDRYGAQLRAFLEAYQGDPLIPNLHKFAEQGLMPLSQVLDDVKNLSKTLNRAKEVRSEVQFMGGIRVKKKVKVSSSGPFDAITKAILDEDFSKACQVLTDFFDHNQDKTVSIITRLQENLKARSELKALKKSVL